MSAEAEEAALLARAGAVAEVLREREVEALLVSEPVNLRYLTGFTGSSGLALIPAEGEPGFFTDFRYETQSEAQLPGIFAREIVTGDLLEAVAHGVAEGGRLGFEEASLSVKRHARLAELLGEGSELVPCGGVIEGLREVKDAGEVARIRAAAELAEEALRGVLEEGLAGRTEREVAIELELRMRRLGAERPSFPSIVAA
ncbi:MAG TPA: aminopeptidase P family N-terminal domain-containing protein, partial [Solirubrobacteraceae bacterium]|nr:aminopeptidase P family N-terminal domain-containing protein [Solirubrobacteraceae bacterium]